MTDTSFCRAGDIKIGSIAELIVPKTLSVPEVTPPLNANFTRVFHYEV